jgi:hypothetical protein
MRSELIAALAIVLAAAAPATAKPRAKAQASAPAADADGWQEYSYPKLGFSVELPRAPDVHEGVAQTVDGQKKTTSYTVDDGGAGAAMINVTDYGGSGRDPAALLDMAAKDAVRTMNGLLVSETQIQLAGAPGIDVMMTIPNGGAVDRIVWANGRLYQVLLAGPQTTGAASSYRTTSSFKILQ